MLYLHKILLPMVLACSLTGSCSTVTQRQYDIDKSSPNGSYRVQIRVTPGEPGESVDKAKFQFFRGQDIVDTWDWEQQDQWEPPFKSFMPIEWVGNNVLHMGAERPKDGLSDQITVINGTHENLMYVSISYDRYESFRIFDLDFASQVTLYATPRFASKGTFNNSFGYDGISQSGKKFRGIIEGPERESPADGPLKFQIMIAAKDLL